MRVRINFFGGWRQFVARPFEQEDLPRRRTPFDLGVRIGNGCLLQVRIDRLASLLVNRLHGNFNVHPGAIREPVFRVGELSLFQDFSAVAFHIDLEDHFERRLLGLGLADHPDRLAGGLQAVHAGRRDANPLLPTGLLDPVEFGPVEKLGKDPVD